MPIRLLSCMVLCSVATLSLAQEKAVAPLPEPLTLERALQFADEAHPDLLLQDSKIKAAQAAKQKIEANSDFKAYVDLGYVATDVESSTPARADHARVGVIASKRLYDFGQTASQVAAVTESINSEMLTYLDLRTRRRLDILDAYFAVLLADLSFNLYDEAMSIGFVNFDKAQDRYEVGQLSELEVLKFETEYQRLRIERYHSENQQRETRAHLANVLHRPNQLPASLAIPDMSILDRKMPDVEALQQQALEKNYYLQSLRSRLSAAEKDLAAARSGDSPVLLGKVQAYEYDVENGASEDEVRAELSLKFNLYETNTDAAAARELARVYAARAQLQKSELDIKQSVLSLWHQLEELKVKQEQADVLSQYRELSLEQSRALYEMEVKADLGDAMVELTEAQLLTAQINYQFMLAWYKMDLLTGKINLDTAQQITQPVLNVSGEKQ